MLTFPTRPGLSKGGQPYVLGSPLEASACRCGRPLMIVGEDTCWRCGHLPEVTIRQTWADRAALLASSRRRRRKLAV